MQISRACVISVLIVAGFRVVLGVCFFMCFAYKQVVIWQLLHQIAAILPNAAFLYGCSSGVARGFCM